MATALTLHLPTSILPAITGLLLITMTTAAPVESPCDDPSPNEEVVALRQLMNGMHLVLNYAVGPNAQATIQPQVSIQLELNVGGHYTQPFPLITVICSTISTIMFPCKLPSKAVLQQSINTNQ